MHTASSLKNRIEAIDVMRGITIAAMIVVNNPGDWGALYAPEGVWRYIFWPLRHADWHGLTPTDLIFPFFLFLSGVSIWFSFRKAASTSERLKTIVIRSFEMFLIGVFLVNFPFADSSGVLFHKPFEEWRVMGVLQRIALAWGLGATAVLFLKNRPTVLAALGGILLLGYWIALAVGGTPGADPYSLYNHLGHKIDLAVLGANHLWPLPTPRFEPEGLLGSLPAVVSVIIGWFVGREIGERKSKEPGGWLPVQTRLLIAGIVMTLGGALWSVWFPVNKALWSSSYVVVTGGIGILTLSFFLWMHEEKRWNRFTWVAKVFGANAILLYMLDALWVKTSWLIPSPAGEGSFSGWLYQSVCTPLFGPFGGSLAYPLLHIAVYWILLLLLYRKGVFLKL